MDIKERRLSDHDQLRPWECENSEYTWKDAKRSIKEYRENIIGAVKRERMGKQ